MKLKDLKSLSRAYLNRQLLGIENKNHQLEYLVD